MAEMMICPDKKCSAYGTKETPHCRKHKATFSCFDPRRRKIILCPACIPYIPEQPKKPATCPECGEAISASGYCSCVQKRLSDGDTSILETADLKPTEELPPAYRVSNWCDTCKKRVGCKGNVGKVMSCPEYEAERQVSRDFDTIEYEPAEHRYCNEGHTIPLEEDSELCRGACTDFYPKDGKCIHLSLEPEPAKMPLIDTRIWKCPTCNRIMTVDLVAHDQQVRQAAVKKFAEKCIKEMPLWGEITDREIAEWLRAMAEGGR